MNLRAVQVRPGRVELIDAEPAALGPGDARVGVAACGVCGTDVHMLQGMVLPKGVSYPLRPGHEVSGVVVERGEAAGVAVGARVVLHPLRACGECAACLAGDEQRCQDGRILGIHDPGGMADQVVWPADRMVDVGDLDLRQAALLADAGATAHHALRLAGLADHAALGVIGAGGLGTQVIQLARVLLPSAQIVAVTRSDASTERARSLGARAFQGLQDAARRVRREEGELDAVVDFSGSPSAAAEGARMLRRGGRLVLGSVVDEPLELGTTVTGFVTRELQVVGAYTSSIEDLRAVADLAGSGMLDVSGSVSAVMALDDAVRAFEVMSQPSPGLVRLVLQP
ncbi:MAG: alcohol dehydrogenase catalytic domain-containing protein [Acidimicrobiales bacterium]